MDRKELNEQDIKIGKKVLADLDKANFPAPAALWFKNSFGWRYIIVSPLVDRLGPIESYSKLQKSVPGIIGQNASFFNNVSIVSPSHPLVGLLKVAVRTPPNASLDMRFTGNAINGQYIEDAYIYRMS